jgi:hypothetical protein
MPHWIPLQQLAKKYLGISTRGEDEIVTFEEDGDELDPSNRSDMPVSRPYSCVWQLVRSYIALLLALPHPPDDLPERVRLSTRAAGFPANDLYVAPLRRARLSLLLLDAMR